jgi:flavin reductase (DIM6/NTAB) family NADH-FMN oxidoreductase RutF
VLCDAPRVGISVLAEEHTQIARDLAAKSSARFARIPWTTGDGGSVFVHGATLWLDCVISREVAAGDHDIVLFGRFLFVVAGIYLVGGAPASRSCTPRR